MSYLLDTHALLWWLTESNRLPVKIRSFVDNPHNVIYVSSASAWEISIKKKLGKLEAPDNLEEALRLNNFYPLDITIAHGLAAGALPPYHKDPFDRMLVAQARLEGLTIITHDKIFSRYLKSVVVT